jgi:hypothetical protein
MSSYERNKERGRTTHYYRNGLNIALYSTQHASRACVPFVFAQHHRSIRRLRVPYSTEVQVASGDLNGPGFAVECYHCGQPLQQHQHRRLVSIIFNSRRHRHCVKICPESWVYPAARHRTDLPSTTCAYHSLALFQHQSVTKKNQRNITHYQNDQFSSRVCASTVP